MSPADQTPFNDRCRPHKPDNPPHGTRPLLVVLPAYLGTGNLRHSRHPLMQDKTKEPHHPTPDIFSQQFNKIYELYISIHILMCRALKVMLTGAATLCDSPVASAREVDCRVTRKTSGQKRGRRPDRRTTTGRGRETRLQNQKSAEKKRAEAR